MAKIDYLPKWDHKMNKITNEWKNEHDHVFDYPYNGCLFDRCHQWFLDQRDMFLGMAIGGSKQDIKNITKPFYEKQLDFTKLLT